MDKVKDEKKNSDDEIKGGLSQKINISEILEKDIKIIIKYILFQKEVQDNINFSKNSSSYKLFSNCYLTTIL